jgi:hypothetical protein
MKHWLFTKSREIYQPAVECPECGSGNIIGPDTAGLYDCLDCGVWFTDTGSDLIKHAKLEYAEEL